MPAGRPPKLTQALIREISILVPRVFFLSTAADLLGISRMTLHRWQKRGEVEIQRRSRPSYPGRPGEALYAEFCYALKRARAQAELFLLSEIKRAADTDWRAAAWLLERCFPERWGRHSREIRELRRQVAQLEKVLALLGESRGQVSLSFLPKVRQPRS